MRKHDYHGTSSVRLDTQADGSGADGRRELVSGRKCRGRVLGNLLALAPLAVRIRREISLKNWSA